MADRRHAVGERPTGCCAAAARPATAAWPCRPARPAIPTSARGPARRRSTARPGQRPRRRRPTSCAGSSVLREPIVAPAPIVIAADAQLVAVEPVAGEVDLGLDRRAVAEREQARDRWEGVEVDALADRRPEGPGVVGDPRRAGEVRRAGGVGELLGRPDAHVHAAAPRVRARPDAAQQQAGAGRRDRHPPGGRDEQRATRPPPTTTTPSAPRRGRRARPAAPVSVSSHDEPPQPDHRLQHQREQRGAGPGSGAGSGGPTAGPRAGRRPGAPPSAPPSRRAGGSRRCRPRWPAGTSSPQGRHEPRPR